MTLDQLQAARPLLNLEALSAEAGRSPSYLRGYLHAGRELPADVQDGLDEALARYGLGTRPLAPTVGTEISSAPHRGNEERYAPTHRGNVKQDEEE